MRAVLLPVLALACLSGPPVAGAESDGATVGWSRHDEVDSNGSAIVTTVLPAREGTLGHVDAPAIPRKPILVVRCRRHELQVFVLFDRPVTSQDRPVRALWQVDSQPVQATLSAVSTDQSAFGAFATQDSRPIYDRIVGGAHLSVRTESERGETASGGFDLGDVANATRPVGDACR